MCNSLLCLPAPPPPPAPQLLSHQPYSRGQVLGSCQGDRSVPGTNCPDWREGQNLRSLPFSLLSSSLAALLSLFPATGLHFHLKQYLESCTGADEMGSFVRVRPQCMACGFDRLDTSKQTARLACGSVCVCICVCLIYAHVFLAHWPPGHQALCTDVWGTTRKLSSIPFLRIAHET